MKELKGISYFYLSVFVYSWEMIIYDFILPLLGADPAKD
jgi:hypothetical protein